MKKIVLDSSMCIGCGACVANCNKAFEFDDEGYAKVSEENLNNLTEEEKEEVKDAKEGCPVDAISIEEI